MGARGPRKKLPEIERLEGNPGRRPVIEATIEAYGEPFTPDHLSDDAAGCIEIIRQSMPPRIYSRLDSFLLSAFATAWAWHKAATHAMNAPNFKPLVSGSQGQKVRNPWFDILNMQTKNLASLGDRLGLDPKARAGLKVPHADEPKSKFAGLLGAQTGSSLSSRN